MLVENRGAAIALVVQLSVAQAHGAPERRRNRVQRLSARMGVTVTSREFESLDAVMDYHIGSLARVVGNQKDKALVISPDFTAQWDSPVLTWDLGNLHVERMD